MQFLVFFIALTLGQENKSSENDESWFESFLQPFQDLFIVILDNEDFNWDVLEEFTFPQIIGSFFFVCFCFYLAFICGKKTLKQANPVQLQMPQFIWNKAPKTQNTIKRLTKTMALFKTQSLKLSFKESYSWSIMEIENISITLNIDLERILTVNGNYKVKNIITFAIMNSINRLTQVIELFETKKLNLNFKFQDEWFKMDIENIVIIKNIDDVVVIIVDLYLSSVSTQNQLFEFTFSKAIFYDFQIFYYSPQRLTVDPKQLLLDIQQKANNVITVVTNISNIFYYLQVIVYFCDRNNEIFNFLHHFCTCLNQYKCRRYYGKIRCTSKVCINNTTEQLSQLMVLFETRTLKLSFQQWVFWFTMEIENTSFTRNYDRIDLKIVGKDIHGKWQLNGSIYINNDQIECSLNKAYDNKKAEDREQLYYRGIYNENDLKFQGNWQFEKSGLQGRWEGQFK